MRRRKELTNDRTREIILAQFAAWAILESSPDHIEKLKKSVSEDAAHMILAAALIDAAHAFLDEKQNQEKTS